MKLSLPPRHLSYKMLPNRGEWWWWIIINHGVGVVNTGVMGMRKSGDASDGKGEKQVGEEGWGRGARDESMQCCPTGSVYKWAELLPVAVLHTEMSLWGLMDTHLYGRPALSHFFFWTPGRTDLCFLADRARSKEFWKTIAPHQPPFLCGLQGSVRLHTCIKKKGWVEETVKV